MCIFILYLVWNFMANIISLHSVYFLAPNRTPPYTTHTHTYANSSRLVVVINKKLSGLLDIFIKLCSGLVWSGSSSSSAVVLRCLRCFYCYCGCCYFSKNWLPAICMRSGSGTYAKVPFLYAFMAPFNWTAYVCVRVCVSLTQAKLSFANSHVLFFYSVLHM